MAGCHANTPTKRNSPSPPLPFHHLCEHFTADFIVADGDIEMNPVTNSEECFGIQINDDLLVEEDEVFVLTVELADDGLADQVHPLPSDPLTLTLIIQDNDRKFGKLLSTGGKPPSSKTIAPQPSSYEFEFLYLGANFGYFSQ